LAVFFLEIHDGLKSASEKEFKAIIQTNCRCLPQNSV
jgi:hypothetical protein